MVLTSKKRPDKARTGKETGYEGFYWIHIWFLLQQRYLSFHSGFGSRFMNGEASLEECEEHTRKQNGEVVHSPGRSEHWEALFHRYVDSKN